MTYLDPSIPPLQLANRTFSGAHTEVAKEALLTLLSTAKSIEFPSSSEAIADSIDSQFKSGRINITSGASNQFNEGEIIRVKEGFVINLADKHMRVRDSKALVVADSGATTHDRFTSRFQRDFSEDRSKHFSYLQIQDLVVTGFTIPQTKELVVVVAPKKYQIFNYTQSEIMGFKQISMAELENGKIASVIYLNPESRHTLYEGKQVVTHDRSRGLHEIFANGLYPGPSCKKGIYGVLLERAEQAIKNFNKKIWTIPHAACAAVKGHSNKLYFFAHMGPSGAGKTEITEPLTKGEYCIANHPDGSQLKIDVKKAATVSLQQDDFGYGQVGKIKGFLRFIMINLEKAFFIRTDSVLSKHDNTELQEIVRTAPKKGKRLVFLSYDVQPNQSVCLFKPLENCKNPRVVVPSSLFPEFHDNPAAVDFCSFGIRAPKSTKENPDYGVIGMGQILSAKQFLAWSLCCPLGEKNPSIASSTSGLVSEGVGAFQAFLVGDRIAHANALWEIFNQVEKKTVFGLFPNQNIGAYQVNWPQRIIRDGLVSANFSQLNADNLDESGSPILGKVFSSFDFQDQQLPAQLLNPKLQPELGEEAYSQGCAKLEKFFWETLGGYLKPNLEKEGSPNGGMPLNENIKKWIIEIRAELAETLAKRGYPIADM